MPYRVRGKTVQVRKAGRWRALKTHGSAAKAKRHARALNANVRQ